MILRILLFFGLSLLVIGCNESNDSLPNNFSVMEAEFKCTSNSLEFYVGLNEELTANSYGSITSGVSTYRGHLFFPGPAGEDGITEPMIVTTNSQNLTGSSLISPTRAEVFSMDVKTGSARLDFSASPQLLGAFGRGGAPTAFSNISCN